MEREFFRQKIYDAQFPGLILCSFRSTAGQNDHGGRRVDIPNLLEHGDPIHIGEIEVQDGHLRRLLDERVETTSGHVSICPMHLAKGLEFRAVVVMACDDRVLPLQTRIGAAADESELEEVYNTERQLLYVAATRARERLLVTGVEPASEFLEDLGS